MFWNHLITSDVFCHWFTFNAVLILVLICCRICLLILPNSLFVGLSNLYFGFALKLSLWSLIIAKHYRFVVMSILLSMVKLFAIFVASILIFFGNEDSAFLHVFVMLSWQRLFVRFCDVIMQYRLLNPTKSELGKISKHILQQISTNIRTSLNVYQWQNASEVIKWFQNIKNKKLHTLTAFDIQEFYPSIVEKFLKDAVLFAQTHANISRKDIEVIFHCLRSLLFHNNEPWIKKDSNDDFDVTMGSYDGAEVC